MTPPSSNNEYLQQIAEKLDLHIQKHDDDYKQLLWWIIGTIVGLFVSGVSMFITYGQTIEKVNRLENEQADKVNRQELQSAISLIDNKFDNIDEKLDDIKEGLNIK